MDLALALTIDMAGRYNKHKVAEGFRERVIEMDLLATIGSDIEEMLGGKMLVVIANELPPAVRGRMYLWFVEPRPNVFVSRVKDSVDKAVVDYLYEPCRPDRGLMVFRRINEVPGYEIRGVGDTRRNIIEIFGLKLVQEKGGDTISCF